MVSWQDTIAGPHAVFQLFKCIVLQTILHLHEAAQGQEVEGENLVPEAGRLL